MIYKLFGFIFILCFICLWWLFASGDLRFIDTQANLLQGMDQCFKDKQIPCRWIPNLDQQYGSPRFNYQAPLPYYIGEAVFLLVKNYHTAIEIIYVINFLGVFIFSYLFLKKLLGEVWGFVAAIFYTGLLILIINLFSFEAIGFSLGLVFLPVIFLSINMMVFKKGIQSFLIFAIFLALLILSSGYYLIFFLLILFWLIFKYVNLKEKDTFLLLSFFSVILAFALAAFYFLPSVLERNLIQSIPQVDKMYYLPKSAKEIPQEAADSQYQILTGDSQIFNFENGTNWFKFKTNTKSHTIIRISQFYFPDWKISIDEKDAKVEYLNNSFGLMTIILGKGEHIIVGKLNDTPIRSISNIISLGALMLVILISLTKSKKIKVWLSYYKKRIG